MGQVAEPDLDVLVHALKTGPASRQWALELLRQRARRRLWGKHPRLVGTCAAGHRVYLIGAMSTGFIGHERNHTTCEHDPVTWDADALAARRRHAYLLASLR